MKDPNKVIVSEKNGRRRVMTVNKEPSMTQQQFKEECDINNLMKRYSQDPSAFQALTKKGGVYADFSEISDYQNMLDQVIRAQDAFASLPAETRARFGNDPGQLLEFIQDKNNYDEGVKLGLVIPKTIPAIPAIPTSKNESNDKTEGSAEKK